MKRPNCYMPACGLDGKLCPDCASLPPAVVAPIDTHSAFYRDGSTEGTAHHKRGHYREPEDGENREWRAGYEAAWKAAFFAKHQKQAPQPTLF